MVRYGQGNTKAYGYGYDPAPGPRLQITASTPIITPSHIHEPQTSQESIGAIEDTSKALDERALVVRKAKHKERGRNLSIEQLSQAMREEKGKVANIEFSRRAELPAVRHHSTEALPLVLRASQEIVSAERPVEEERSLVSVERSLSKTMPRGSDEDTSSEIDEKELTLRSHTLYALPAEERVSSSALSLFPRLPSSTDLTIVPTELQVERRGSSSSLTLDKPETSSTASGVPPAASGSSSRGFAQRGLRKLSIAVPPPPSLGFILSPIVSEPELNDSPEPTPFMTTISLTSNALVLAAEETSLRQPDPPASPYDASTTQSALKPKRFLEPQSPAVNEMVSLVPMPSTPSVLEAPPPTPQTDQAIMRLRRTKKVSLTSNRSNLSNEVSMDDSASTSSQIGSHKRSPSFDGEAKVNRRAIEDSTEYSSSSSIVRALPASPLGREVFAVPNTRTTIGTIEGSGLNIGDLSSALLSNGPRPAFNKFAMPTLNLQREERSRKEPMLQLTGGPPNGKPSLSQNRDRF